MEATPWYVQLSASTLANATGEAKRNFQQALDLHLSVLREKATKELSVVAQ